MKAFICILSLFLSLPTLSLSAEPTHDVLPGRFGQALETVYPTDEPVIADFIVTDYGARPEPGFDNRESFQAAIDAAWKAGGGVVFVPAGNYEFRSTSKGKQTVRVREGESDVRKEFRYSYVLSLPSGVQLRGDRADPDACGQQVLGTILEVRVGKDSPACDASVKSWWNDGQAGNALRTTYTSIADRFIEMGPSTGIISLSIWYPEQDIRDVHPYPWTLFQKRGNSATVRNVTLVNSYNGFMSSPSELHYLENCRITALNKGVEVHVCTDIGRVEHVLVSPEVWAESGLPGAPSRKMVRSYMMSNATGFQMHRSDWEYVSHLDVVSCRTGIWIGREPGFDDAPNAQFFDIHTKDCRTGLYVQEANPYGLLFSNSSFNATYGPAVHLSEDFKTCIQFNNCNFSGTVRSAGKGGVLSFEYCTFNSDQSPAVDVLAGQLMLASCRLPSGSRQFSLGPDVRVSGLSDTEWSAETYSPFPTQMTTDIRIQPRPSSNRVFIAAFPKASGYNDRRPQKDVSALIQQTLDSLARMGGGTLYLPSGRYLVNHPIILPAGTELRGSWDVPHHTVGGGTAIFTEYDGGEAGETGIPLIRLQKKSGLRGLVIAQLNLVDGGYSIEEPRRTPFLVQGQGKEVYLVNVTISAGDKGVDLATYDTSGHYVDYLGGVLLRAGIWVGGGAEGGFIRNTQFNPHYALRMPLGKQGYPKLAAARDFVQSHCSAFKFADVSHETIFNNFVYGSVYGIHFLKDAVTGRCPGKMTMVGHGSDGCTFALYVEDADSNTEIMAVNSELVNTQIKAEPVRTYVLMGYEGKASVHPEARLILYNSAMWGSPTAAAIVYGGHLDFHQANFHRMGPSGIQESGGKVTLTSVVPAARW